MTIRDADFARWLVTSMGSGLVAVDPRGCVVALSQGAARLLGVDPDPDAALGRPCGEVLTGQPALARLLLDALMGRELPGRAELVLEATESKPPRTIGFTLVRVLDDTRRLHGAAVLFRDLTPYERMDEQERLRERLAALGQMAAGLAHEIRNPLAGMEVLGGLLKRRVADRPEELGLIEELLGEVRTLADTVTASLEFVKPMALASARVDACSLLDACLETALSRIPYAGRIAKDYPPEVPPLRADPEQLRSVLTDLLVNALEAMAGETRDGEHVLRLAVFGDHGPAPVLRVGSRRGATGPGAEGRPELVIAISDTGPGVAPELAQRIFYPFFTTKQGGSGIGLANAQKVVGSHGGSLELDSQPGSGATFRVRLPREPGS